MSSCVPFSATISYRISSYLFQTLTNKDIKFWFLIEGNNHSKPQNVVIHVFLANKVPGYVRREVRRNVKKWIFNDILHPTVWCAFNKSSTSSLWLWV